MFWRTASYNMDLTQFSKKFGADLRATQVGTPMYGIFAPGTSTPNPGFAAGWSDAGVIIPWTAWLQSGDTRVAEQNWDAMEKYLAAIQAANPGYLWRTGYGIPFGDWLSPEGPTLEPLVATAYWAYDVTLMQQMAHALGKNEEEAKYAALFSKIKAAFAKEFIHADGFIAGADNGPSPFGAINNPEAKSQAAIHKRVMSWRSTCTLCPSRCAPQRPIDCSPRSKQTTDAWQPGFWVLLIF